MQVSTLPWAVLTIQDSGSLHTTCSPFTAVLSTRETLDKVTLSRLKHTTLLCRLLLFYGPLASQAQQHCWTARPCVLMPQESPCTPADPVQSDCTSAVPHGALKQSQLLHLLQPPAHREHFWDLGYTFPSAPLVGTMAFRHQGPPMSSPLSELILVSGFSICKPSNQDAAAAKAVSRGKGHRPAAASLPAPRFPPPPQLQLCYLQPWAISCTDWIFIINF